MDIPLSRSDYFRGVAKEARIRTRNRYFEQNPVLADGQPTALLPRPGLKRFIEVGDGPIRGVYSQDGSFNDALFVLSGDELWRVDTTGFTTLIGTLPSPGLGFASFAATSNIGVTPAYLFVCAGADLMCYMENGYSTGSISGSPAANDTVQIGTTYYKFTAGSLETGPPDGTVTYPWLVLLGVDDAGSWQNFSDALGDAGTPGVHYSTALVANPDITVQSTIATGLSVRANAIGAEGNAVATTETGAAIAWGGSALAGGGGVSFFQVSTPGNVGIISVGYIASYVVAVPAQGQDINGRFFWIEPGETTINALDFATAERAPDPVSGVVVFGDQFWLPGDTTTEVWYFTGNIDAPVLRTKGVVFDRGSWSGTAIQVKESMIIVDNQGAVFKIDGGMKRISRPDVEERIREAIQYQAANV